MNDPEKMASQSPRRNLLLRRRLSVAQLRALIAPPHPTCSGCGAVGVLQVHGGYSCKPCFARRKPWNRWHRRSIRGEAYELIASIVAQATRDDAELELEIVLVRRKERAT